MFGRRLGGSQASWGQERSRAETLAEHHSALAELKADLSKRPAFQLPNVVSRKPVWESQPPALALCSRIRIQDLEVGSTHRGSVLRGRLITEAIKMQSVQSVLEDEAGDVVVVHMYNIPTLPALTTTLGDLRKAQELFPQGQSLAVIEPFFKLMLDGTYGIRVDNPAEVVFLDSDRQPLFSAADISAREARAPASWTPTSSSSTVLKPKRPNRRKKGFGGGKRR